ncbi:unnamed protein product [Candida verbasci]|uniref:M-phase phosphoprotein 6 n=1 Tax=Candida verbasci TaxID=1227364 RepID=A0A9W4TPA0_9ASCO|nr:unnamed protein product [Candida verbasci]
MSSALSNRVMNMKFMQKAEDVKMNEQIKEEQQQLKDLSEWVLPYSEKLLKLSSLKPKIETIGYGGIMSDRNYTTKRSWGTSIKVEDMDQEPMETNDLSTTKDLNTLWRKRKLNNSNDSTKKKRMI